MQEIMNRLRNEVSPKRLYETVKEVSSRHRIQSSPGFRLAADDVCNKLKEMGFDTNILSFEADENQWYLEQRMFREWDCRQAWLEIEGMGRVCDFEEEAQSIIQKSWPAEGTGTGIVEINDTDPEVLKTMDLEGKMLFVHFHPRHSLDLIKDTGALGFITDFIMESEPIRTRYDLYDIRNYTSFWWKHTADEPHTFGFVLTPRQGDILKRKLVDDPALTCDFRIDSSLYPGKMEVVEALLPGESSDEILLTAHLCHPRPSANDNASGTAGAIEVMRVLKSLPKLQKTVRMLLLPEMTGSYCYLSTLSSYDHIKAAINLDMIGGKQDGTYGPITLTLMHHAIDTPLNSIALMVMDHAKQQVDAFAAKKVPLVNAAIQPYVGGSDHIIYADPTVNIPCLMLGQWPDKYYHTSGDTLEHVDPHVLAFSVTFAAGYIYALSEFDEDMHREALSYYGEELIAELRDIRNFKAADASLETVCAGKRAKALVDYYCASISGYRRFASIDIHDDAEYLQTIGKAAIKQLGLEACEEPFFDPSCTAVYRRCFIGPIEDIENYGIKYPDKKEAVAAWQSSLSALGRMGNMLSSHVVNYINGTNTVNDIIDHVENELGYKLRTYIISFLRLLEELHLIETI